MFHHSHCAIQGRLIAPMFIPLKSLNVIDVTWKLTKR